MSLNHRQIAATRNELATNLMLSGLTVADVAATLGLSNSDVQSALNVDGGQPREVWLVRDYLERMIRSDGSTPHPYSSLTEQSRAAAQGWFQLFDVDVVLNRATR
jgi:hypothetical protein